MVDIVADNTQSPTHPHAKNQGGCRNKSFAIKIIDFKKKICYEKKCYLQSYNEIHQKESLTFVLLWNKVAIYACCIAPPCLITTLPLKLA